jgi:hypothetical protein
MRGLTSLIVIGLSCSGCGGVAQSSPDSGQPDICSEWDLGASSCLEADAEAIDLETGWTVEPPYGDSRCQNQYVFQVDLRESQLQGLWLRHRWDGTELPTEELCRQARVHITVWREGNRGDWTEWDRFVIHGVVTDLGCETSHHGYLDTGARNTTVGFPWSWVDTADISSIRVAAVVANECNQGTLVLSVRERP